MNLDDVKNIIFNNKDVCKIENSDGAVLWVKPYTVTLSSSDSTLGTVSPNGVSNVRFGDSFTAVATPVGSSRFVQWKEDGSTVSDVASYVFSVDSDRSLVADFIQRYEVLVINDGYCNISGGNDYYDEGSICTLRVVSTVSPHRFSGWYDNSTGKLITTSNPYSFTVDKNITVEARTVVYYTVTLDIVGTGNALGGGTFLAGDTCTLTATETTTGWRFVGWYNGDQLVTTDKTFSFTVTASITMRAVFSNEYTITTTNNGNGSTYGGTTTYGRTVTISAYPNTGYIFSHWTHDDLYVSYDKNYTVTVTKDDAYKGWFCASGNALVKVSNLNPEVITSHGWINVADSSKRGSLSYGINEIPNGNTRIYFSYDSSQMPKGSSCRITFKDKDGNVTTYTASNSTIYNITGYTEITFDVYMPA